MRGISLLLSCIPIFLFLLLEKGCVAERGSSQPFYEQVSRSGRMDVLEDGSLALIGSASSVEFLVRSEEVVVEIQSQYPSGNSFVVAINDVYQERYLLEDDKVKEFHLTLPDTEVNKVGIFKATEAATGNLVIRDIQADSGLEKTPTKAKTVEFIGNSITCGAAADTETIPCGTRYYHDQHNAYLAYGPRAARALGVNYFLSSVSGIGIYRNWNDEHLMEPIMPEVYENLYLNGEGKKEYDFSQSPDLVSICLGTNDLSYGDGVKDRRPFNRKMFVSNYLDFVRTVRSHYPQARIALLSSPIVNGDRRSLLIDCLHEIKNELRPEVEVEVFEFEPMEARGCTGHPSIEDHEKIAEALIPFFKGLLSL